MRILNIKSSALLVVALCAGSILAKDANKSDQFAKPVELLTDGASINSVIYPSPTLYDLDNDGKLELLIGDIGGDIHWSTKSGSKLHTWGKMVKLESVDGKPLKLKNW